MSHTTIEHGVSNRERTCAVQLAAGVLRFMAGRCTAHACVEAQSAIRGQLGSTSRTLQAGLLNSAAN